VQQQVGVRRFLQRRLEGLDQLVRQVADEAHRVGQDTERPRFAQVELPVVVSSVANNWSAA
jgi:hypothetical protein